MKSATVAIPVNTYDKARLFLVSAMALASAGVAYSIRANTAADLQRVFLDPIDRAHSAEMIATILGVPFLAFAITIAIGSPLLDVIGMRVLLPLSPILLSVGMLMMAFAGNFVSGPNMYWALWSGALVAGIGWGLAETVINPLIASLYPDNKTAKLNAAHAWWPGGVVVGGLVGVGMSRIDLGWQAKLTVVLLPAIVCVILTLGVKFPPTERKAAGVSAGEMFKELLKPMFFVLFCSMFLTAASELAPGQWVDLALTRTVGMQGILLLVYVNGLMFVMRHFAGPLVHRLSPIGVLWCSCLGASLGLVALSFANSPIMGLLAATLWGTGVCYMWPTMLATASERFPRGGALLMGLMGTAGTLSIQFVLPIMGTIYDRKKIEVAGGEAAFNALQPGPRLEHILGVAAQASFRAVAILPAVLLIVFGAIWLYDRASYGKGGFRPKDLMSFKLGLLVFVVSAHAASLHDRFNSQQAYAYTAQIAGFGERWPGSPGHTKTEALIRQVLKKDGARIDADDFTATTPRGPIAVHNIIGKFNVSGDPKQEIFILAGHYDTLFQKGFVGANDGGSSTAILLAFADALAGQKMKMQIWLVWTDLEEAINSFTGEDGLYGSRHLAQKLVADGTRSRVRGFFLLDMIGDKQLGVARETESNRGLQDVIARAAAQLGYSQYFFQYEVGIIDDHVPFIQAGIPAVDVVDARYGRMGFGFDSMGEFHHANTDTMDKVSQQSLEVVGRTILLTVELLDK